MQRSALCRSRRELSNEYLLAKIGVDTAENEPLEVWGKIQFSYSFASLKVTQPFNMREVTEFLSSRYTAAYEDHKRTSSSNEKKKSTPAVVLLRSEVNSELNFSPNFEGLVLGCIDADFCK